MMRGNHRLWIFSRGKIPLRIMLFLVPLIFAMFINFQNVYADDSSITVNTAGITHLILRPGIYNSVVMPVEVTTNNPTGYTVVMRTSGNSTDLERVGNGNYAIPTITLPSGTTSIPASSILNSYGYSLDGTNFKPAPSPLGVGATIAEIDEIDGTETNTHNITFGAKVNMDMPAGDYSKDFVIMVVANSIDICESDTICYYKNGSTDAASLDNQTVSSNTNVTLSSPNFSRPGYGFAGWNTKSNGTGTNYGPNETIRVGDVSASGLNLYANWIESEGTLQNWTGCDSMSIGAITALTDSRDGNTYAVAKLADGACWVTENLRLDLSDPSVTINSTNTNNPTSSFIDAVNQHPSSSTNFCTNNNASCGNRILFNSDGVHANSENYWNSYGVYYNWYTATAGNGIYSISDPRVKVSGDICPAGWSLPTGYGINGDFALLDISLGGTGQNVNSTTMSNRWRSYPNNFLYSGQQNGSSTTNRGESGNYHGAGVTNATSSSNLWLQPNKVSVNSNGSNKTRGQTVRCMMQKYYKIHYDKNNTAEVTGTMYDQEAAINHNIKLDANTFSAAPQNGAAYRFIGWNTKADGTGDSYANEGSVINLAAAGETATLYAQWEVLPLIDVTVEFPEGAVTEITLTNSEYGSHTVTTSGTTVPLVQTKPYTVSIRIDQAYDFDNWATTSGGTLSSTTNIPTTYTVTEAATLTASATYRTTTTYLQNLSHSSCSSTPRTVYDIRDNEPYTIARLSDGNCWLLEDLRLGSTTLAQPLSSANTNMQENTSLTFTKPSALFDYTTPEIDTIHAGDSVINYGAGSGKAGVYYNYCAASAGTVCSSSSPQNASYDICPAGWRLPTGGNSGEFKHLYDSYSGSVQNFNAGLSVALSGWYDANAVKYNEFNKAVVYWSSTASNNINKTFIVKSTATSAMFNTGYLENNGFSIRCMLKPSQ